MKVLYLSSMHMCINDEISIEKIIKGSQPVVIYIGNLLWQEGIMWTENAEDNHKENPNNK